MGDRPKAAGPRWRAAEARVMQLEAALWAIMRVTDGGDMRSQETRVAWEMVNPARKIAREALGLEIGGTVKRLDAERRGEITGSSAVVAGQDGADPIADIERARAALERHADSASCAHQGPWYWDPEASRSRCCACDELVGTTGRNTQGRDAR